MKRPQQEVDQLVDRAVLQNLLTIFAAPNIADRWAHEADEVLTGFLGKREVEHGESDVNSVVDREAFVDFGTVVTEGAKKTSQVGQDEQSSSMEPERRRAHLDDFREAKTERMVL